MVGEEGGRGRRETSRDDQLGTRSSQAPRTNAARSRPRGTGAAPPDQAAAGTVAHSAESPPFPTVSAANVEPLAFRVITRRS